jgi:hypothetical protein
MRTVTIGVVLLVSLLWCALTDAVSGESAFTVGYGFGLANGSKMERIENGLHYDFFQLSYVYEKVFTERISLGIEPIVTIDNRPDRGLDIGSSVYLKSYLTATASGLYLMTGAGGAYTSLKFQEQGTHELFILQGGLGYRRGRLFVENRFFHYSNGGLAKPNRSVNSNIVRIGCYF